MTNLSTKLFDFFSSLKLAVILILSLGTVLAVGTFYEAEYGTANAQRVIYHSWYVSLLMFLLIANLACAAIDRLPWRRYHIGFVTTHAGIIILLMGSFITQQRGIDGSVSVGINETSDSFVVDENVLRIWQSFDGKPSLILREQPVDFDRKPPEQYGSLYSYVLADEDVLKVTQYIQKAVRKLDVRQVEEKNALPAVRFRLYNDRVDVSEWLGLDNQLPPFYDLGPALVTFVQGGLLSQPQPRNQILLFQNPKSEILSYAIFSLHQKGPIAQGVVTLNKDIPTRWMGLNLRIEGYFTHAQPNLQYEPAGNDETNTVAAIETQLGKNRRWFEVDFPHEIKGDKSSYFVSFGHQRYPLGFQLSLKKFKMGLYGGSTMPMSYESTVAVDFERPDKTHENFTKVVSMNEPLDYKGITLYQSSFEQNERGEPVLSIFAVNYDPGRWMKYIGAMGIVAGIVVMFYFKPRWTRKKKVLT